MVKGHQTGCDLHGNHRVSFLLTIVFALSSVFACTCGNDYEDTCISNNYKMAVLNAYIVDRQSPSDDIGT